MLVKCAGFTSANATWAFVVRSHHRPVYRSAGAANGADAPLEAVRQALAWLRALPALPSLLTLWSCSVLPLEALAVELELLRAAGCRIDLHMNLPDFVTEAGALARRTAMWSPVATHSRPTGATSERTGSARPPGSGLLVICDGGHKPLGPTLGLAVYGFVVQEQNSLIHTENGLVCRGPAAGSQMAELAAAVAALRWLAARPQRQIKLHSDCQGVVDLLTGRRQHRLRRGSVMLVHAANRLINRLRRSGCHLEIAHLPRKQTRAADRLCRQVYRWPISQARVRVTSFLRTKIGHCAGDD